MATGYTQAYVYRDPEKIDISVLGQAASYKEQSYDANTAQIQQLVNQYAGTDLLRDIDKQYFGERISTLTNYIKEAGAIDWSNKNISASIQNYISTAIDENVVNAVASTSAYRKQMAEIEDIKKNKPDQYSMQNEWFATQDLDRYLKSGQIGDRYRAQSYVPYTDVKKLVLENSKHLKEFGLEVGFDQIPGGSTYFKYIGKKERVAPEVVKQYLGMVLDSKAMNQLYIDGQYAFKGLEPEQVKEQFVQKLNTQKNYNQERLQSLRMELPSADKKRAAELQQNIAILEADEQNIEEILNSNMSKSAMADSLYRTDFINNTVGFLSFDRLVDYKVDDSLFQEIKFKNQVEQQAWDNNYKNQVFAHTQRKDWANLDLEQQKLELSREANNLKKEEIQAIYDTGANATLNPSGLGDVDGQPNQAAQIERSYINAGTALITDVHQELQTLINTKEYAAVKAQVGDLSDPKAMWKLVNSPSRTEALYNILSPESKKKVDQARQNTAMMREYDQKSSPILADIRQFGETIKDTGSEDVKNMLGRSTNGLIVDKSGRVVRGNILESNDEYSRLSRTLGTINLALMESDITAEERSVLKRQALNEIMRVTGNDGKKSREIASKMVYNSTSDGFWDTLATGITEIPTQNKSVRTALGIIGTLTGLDGLVTLMNRRDNNPNTESAINKVVRRTQEFTATLNASLSDIGSGISASKDVDRDRLGFNPSSLRDRIKNHIKNSNEAVNNPTQTFVSTITVDNKSKFGADALPQLKSFFPVGTQFQADGISTINVDPTSGTATVTMSVKNGKTYEPMTIQGVSTKDLPSNIQNRWELQQSESLYSASNKFAPAYQSRYEIPDTLDDYYAKVEMMPLEWREQARANPPMTKAGIANQVVAAYPNLTKEHKEEIIKIISTPVDVYTERSTVNPEIWNIVAGQNGGFYSKPGDKTYDPKLISQYKSQFATEAILEKIKNVIQK